MLSQRTDLRERALHVLRERIHIVSQQPRRRLLSTGLRMLRCRVHTNVDGRGVDDKPRPAHHDSDELHDDNTVDLICFDDNDIYHDDHDFSNLSFQRATAHLDNHPHRHGDAFRHPARDVLFGIPVLSRQPGRRVLPDGPTMRQFELPGHLHHDDLTVQRDARTTRATDESDDDGGDHDHDDHGLDIADIPGDGLPDGLLRVLRLLPGRMLPDWAQLRQHIVPGRRVHNGGVGLDADDRGAHGQRH